MPEFQNLREGPVLSLRKSGDCMTGMSRSWLGEDIRINPAMKSLKMLSNNRRIQSVMEESGGFDRLNGKSQLRSVPSCRSGG
jgi:hypothetical protein